MIRRQITDELLTAAREYPVVTVLGPRQSGKTTLVRASFPDLPYVTMEEPDVRVAAEADPRAFLGQFPRGAILDEVQNLPLLLSYIQGLVDGAGWKGLFVLTGSHQPRLQEAISQSLAGRTALLTLWPFSVSELRSYKQDWDAFELIVKGGYPRLHDNALDPRRFYSGYMQTYVERDVRALIQLRDLDLFQRFLALLAGRVGQLVNHTALSADTGVSRTTVREWMSVLKASFVLLELPPFFGNIRKRLVKSPKVYFTDPGLVSFLLGIHQPEQAARDPLRGGLYENLVICDIVKGALNRGIRPEIYFYRDSQGNEVDLLIREGGCLIPVEMKSAQTFSPAFLKALRSFDGLGLRDAAPGVVLYNGMQQGTIKGIRYLNPLSEADIWACLTEAR